MAKATAVATTLARDDKRPFMRANLDGRIGAFLVEKVWPAVKRTIKR